MARVRARSEDIRRFILEHVEKHPTDISKVVAQHFTITRQAVNKHLQKLTAERALDESGNTRNRIYKLAPLFQWAHTYKITPELAEDVVWRNEVQPLLDPLLKNVLGICHYGFTEMFNNAIDHSGGTKIIVQIKKTAISTEITLIDNGVGIFKKIQTELNLLDERHAIFELAKGKLTTDPRHHTGQGIFFTSRMFDFFYILSGGLLFSHQFGKAEDWLTEHPHSENGTMVWMEIHNHTARTTRKIFGEYSSADDECEFNKTVVPIKLAQYGNDTLISRSQAKRILARIELFKRVVFDFEGVDMIGHSFADEIFRVFAMQHPEIELLPVNTNSAVEQMIKEPRLTGRLGRAFQKIKKPS